MRELGTREQPAGGRSPKVLRVAAKACWARAPEQAADAGEELPFRSTAQARVIRARSRLSPAPAPRDLRPCGLLQTAVSPACTDPGRRPAAEIREDLLAAGRPRPPSPASPPTAWPHSAFSRGQQIPRGWGAGKRGAIGGHVMRAPPSGTKPCPPALLSRWGICHLGSSKQIQPPCILKARFAFRS